MERVDNQNQESKGPLRFGTAMYADLAGHHAIVVEALQNELSLAVAAANRFKQQAEAAEAQARHWEEQAKAGDTATQQLRSELEQLRGKLANRKARHVA